MGREYNFLKEKYYRQLIPNLFTEISDKLGNILDVIVVGLLIGSSQLPVLNLVAPFYLASTMIYALYGQGGSLLAIKAKSDRDDEKANAYFTYSIVGALLSCLVYILFVFIFADPILKLLNIPETLFEISKTYLFIVTGFYTLNVYIRVLAFFLKAVGRAKHTLKAVIIANIINLALDFLLFNVFEEKIVGIAIALVIGYLIGAIYISKYLFDKNAEFKLISPWKLSFKDLNLFRLTALCKTPEFIGRIAMVIKTTVVVYLCATYLGHLGLLVFLIYDNIDTIFYMFVSGIIKTISPFITLFYNEKDYPSVEYITELGIKHILMIILTISIIFIVYPQIIFNLLNINSAQQQAYITHIIPIIIIGLVGRGIGITIYNYTQSIFQSKISGLINILHEILPYILMLVLHPLFYRTGIWIMLALSNIIPSFVYFAIIFSKRKKYPSLKNSALMIPESLSFHWTIIRGNFEELNENMKDSNKEIIKNIKKLFKDDYLIIIGALEDITKNIFSMDKKLSEIDVSLILNDDFVVLRFIYDGKTYEPLKNEKLLEKENIKKLNQLNHKFDYYRILDINLSYIKILKD